MATLVFVHGAGEPSECFTEEFAWLNRQDVAVVTGDLPGYGHSPGRRGHIQSFAQYVDATSLLIHLAEQVYPGIPLYMWGYSMGGLIALRYAQLHDDSTSSLRGYVLFAPCLGLSKHVPLWQRTLAQSASRIWPTLTQKTGLIANDDMYRVNVATVRWYTELTDAMKSVWAEQSRIAGLGKPMLIQQGLADHTVSSDRVLAFAHGLPSQTMTMITYENTDHNLIASEHSSRTMIDLLAWVKASATPCE